MADKRYLVISERGEIIKVWDSKFHQMWQRVGDEFEKVGLSLESHLDHMPYVSIEEESKFPGEKLTADIKNKRRKHKEGGK